MNEKRYSIMILVAVLTAFSFLTAPIFIADNAGAHTPPAIYLTYKADPGTLTVYIDHPSDDPDTHYIESVTVLVNRLEYLSKTYTSQKADDEKGMVTYSYTMSVSEGDSITVVAECSIEGSITESIVVGEGDSKDTDGKDDDKKDYDGKDYDRTKDDGKNNTDVESESSDFSMGDLSTSYLFWAIIILVIATLVALLMLQRTRKIEVDEDKNRGENEERKSDEMSSEMKDAMQAKIAALEKQAARSKGKSGSVNRKKMER